MAPSPCTSPTRPRTTASREPVSFPSDRPGAVVRPPAEGGKVRVRAAARSLRRFDRLDVVSPAGVVARAEARGSPTEAALDAEIPVAESGWLVARCWGPYDGDVVDLWAGAQSSPVYVEVKGRPLRPDPAVVDQFTGQFDRMLRWAELKARCADARQRERLAGIFRTARAALLRR